MSIPHSSRDAGSRLMRAGDLPTARHPGTPHRCRDSSRPRSSDLLCNEQGQLSKMARAAGPQWSWWSGWWSSRWWSSTRAELHSRRPPGSHGCRSTTPSSRQRRRSRRLRSRRPRRRVWLSHAPLPVTIVPCSTGCFHLGGAPKRVTEPGGGRAHDRCPYRQRSGRRMRIADPALGGRATSPFSSVG